MKVPEHEHHLAVHFFDGLQGGQRILGLRRGRASADARLEVIRVIPHVEGALGALAETFQLGQNALFIQADHADQRNARAEVQVYFLVEVHTAPQGLYGRTGRDFLQPLIMAPSPGRSAPSRCYRLRYDAFLLRQAANPARPEPRNKRDAGSGTDRLCACFLARFVPNPDQSVNG